jgi:hypothetical protein
MLIFISLLIITSRFPITIILGIIICAILGRREIIINNNVS